LDPMGFKGAPEHATVLHRTSRESSRNGDVRLPFSTPEALRDMHASPRVELPRSLIPPLVFKGTEEVEAVEIVCRELGLTRSCERAVAEIYVSSIRAYQRLEQMEAVQFAEGYSELEDLARLKIVSEQRIRYQRAALEAYQALLSTRMPSIAILAGQVNVGAAIGR
jgi:hypothetical protein